MTRDRPVYLMLWPCAVLIAAAISTQCGGSSEKTLSNDAAKSASPVDPATAGALSGTVVLEGTPPAATVIRLDGDPTCAKLNGSSERTTDFLVMGENNSLQNVFIYVKEGVERLTFPAPADPVVLDQQQCRYVPHVLGIQVGQPLAIRNSDPLLHNVRADGAINQPFNLGQPIQGMTMTRTFTTREIMVPFKCDVHAWMSAFIGVLDHPFHAVSDGSGRFSLAGLPPGSYTIEAWHEKLGTQTQQVTIGPNESKTLSFAFKI
ncbi:MAG: carboxypeptidase regulatory-like domain-containing protein [Acidobacteria bacterium]|nr:carboxypeptidase regulatory-like domain-containing protein [Acidobacteriota bacterium]